VSRALPSPQACCALSHPPTFNAMASQPPLPEGWCVLCLARLWPAAPASNQRAVRTGRLPPCTVRQGGAHVQEPRHSVLREPSDGRERVGAADGRRTVGLGHDPHARVALARQACAEPPSVLVAPGTPRDAAIRMKPSK